MKRFRGIVSVCGQREVSRLVDAALRRRSVIVSNGGGRCSRNPSSKRVTRFSDVRRFFSCFRDGITRRSGSRAQQLLRKPNGMARTARDLSPGEQGRKSSAATRVYVYTCADGRSVGVVGHDVYARTRGASETYGTT